MKKITFLLFLSIASFFTGHSQVLVGTGTNTSQDLPMNTSSGYSYTQSIYLASEINASGTITSIQWYYTGNEALTNSKNLIIYMGTTSKTAFASSTDWEPEANMTMVFNSLIVTNSTPGWKTITLDNPFVYNGTDNLIIAVDENTAGSDTNGANRFWNSAVSGTRSIGFYNNAINPNPSSPPVTGNISFSASFVPNIIFDGITQACPTPYYLTSSNIDTTTATVSWPEGTSIPTGGSDYYVSTTNIAPTAATVPTGNVPTGTSADLISLTANTTYYVWVRSNCGNDLYSNWSESTTFTTLCLPFTSFNENFDTAITPNLPGCWSKILRGTNLATNARVRTGTSNYNSAPNSVELSNSNSSGDFDVILVSPSVTTLPLGTYRLKFNAVGYSASELQVGTLNSNLAADAVFTTVGTVPTTTTNTQYTVIFNVISTDTYIGIRLSTATTYSTVFVDNILWEVDPICKDVTQITVPSVTPNGATISWTAGSTETSWDIAVGATTVTDPSTLPFVSSTTTSATVSGLDAATNYKVWVRSVCTVGGNGSWIGPISFKTDCMAVATLNENFDTTTTPNLPSCWNKILRGTGLSANAFVRTSNTNSNSAPNSLQLSNSNSSGVFDIILVSPNLSSLSLGTYRLRFFAKGAGTLQVGTLSSNTNSAVFNSLNTVTTTAASTQYTVNFTYTGTDNYIGIRLSTPTPSSIVYLDNIVWELAPLCPDVTSVAVPTVTPDGATITWIGGDETTWNIAIGESTVTDPSTLPFATSTTAGTYNATGLANSTNYNVWVRSVCGANNGYWIGPIAFKTDCPEIAAFSENFDAAVVPNLPNCWSKIVRGAGVQVGYAKVETEINASTASLPNQVVMKNANSTGAYDIILVSPNLSTLSTGSYRLKFLAKGESEANIQVGTLNANTSSGTFTPLTGYENILLSSTSTQYIVNFSSYTGTDKYIGIRLSTPTGFSIVSLDNIIWEPLPSCADVLQITVPETTATTATVAWTAGGSEAAWEVAVEPSTANVPDPLNALVATTTSLEVPNLTAASNYKVWVRSVCGAENGAWIGPINFSTQCEAVATLNENFDSVSFPNLPPCWSKIIRNGATMDSSVSVSWGGATSEPNTATLYGGSSLAFADIILVAPNLSTLYANTTYRLKFNAQGSNAIQVITLNNNSSTADYTVIQEIALGENGAAPQYTVDFSSYNGSQPFVGFRLKTGSTTTSSQYVSIDNVIWENSLGTEQFDLSNFSYYPNPVKDVLNISYMHNIKAVSVFNLLGQEVITKNIDNTLARIDMSALAKGTYLVKVSNADAVKTIKVIKD